MPYNMIAVIVSNAVIAAAVAFAVGIGAFLFRRIRDYRKGKEERK